MDNGSQHSLTLVRLSHGGYIVQDAYISGSGMFSMQHFASADIDAALKFMRDKILPIPPTEAGVEKKPEPEVVFAERSRHYDSQGYCDNPARGY